MESGLRGESARVWSTGTRRSGSGNGSGLSRTVLTSAKTALLAPMAAPRITTMVAAKGSWARRARQAERRASKSMEERTLPARLTPAKRFPAFDEYRSCRLGGGARRQRPLGDQVDEVRQVRRGRAARHRRPP